MTSTRRKRHVSQEVSRAIMTHHFWNQQRGGDIINAQYDYRPNYNGNVVVFRDGRSKGKHECFLLLIDPDKTAVLQSLKQAADCALNPGASGKDMVLAAVKLAKENGAINLSLTDNSTKHISDSKSFRLANMYFLTTGQTWYESILPDLYPTDINTDIESWRHIVKTNTWSTLSRRLGNVSLPVDISDIDIGQAGSAMLVLARIKHTGTAFFADYENKLLVASKISSLYGINWRIDL